jgi:hypothetical protein
MNPLPDRFHIGGFDFKLIGRDGDIAILEKFKAGITTRLFEVVIVQKAGATTWPNGITTGPREHMPHSEQWGVKGWSFSDIEQAWAKFGELREQQQPLLFEA